MMHSPRKEILLMKNVTLWLMAPLAGAFLLVASCSSSGGDGSGGSGSCSGSAICGQLCGYKASTSTPLTLTTDILPIVQDPGGCGTGGGVCHGMPPVLIDGKSKSMTFLGDAATVRAMLIGTTSVNAPSMKRVVPGHVEQSFLAYKISGASGLACADSNCQSGASVGNSKPCGDPMPLAGFTALTDANRTKILDWIAQGAPQ
jgi:hypothetical protein